MIDVREHIIETYSDMEDIVKKREADVRSAFTRLDMLMVNLETMRKVVNETNVENTSEAWHKAYVTMRKAYQDCIKVEKDIIARW